MSNNNDKVAIKELSDINKNRECWKENIDYVAEKLNNNDSVEVKAKALWILGEIGLKHPKEIEKHVEDVIGYMEDENPKLRERSTNAIGRIGRADKRLITPHLDKLMQMRFDESENVRHAFV